MLEVAHDDSPARTSARSSDVLHEELDKLAAALARGHVAHRHRRPGFKDLDEITGGFQPGNLIIIAARPSMGKCALVANIAENAALRPRARPVALFSLEMSEAELAQRFIASQARSRATTCARAACRRQRWPKILEAAEPARARRRCTSTTRQRPRHARVRAKARRLHSQREGGLGPDHHRLPAADARRQARTTTASSRSARSAAA